MEKMEGKKESNGSPLLGEIQVPSLQGFKIPDMDTASNLLNDVVELFKENFHVRTLFDFNMDVFMKVLEILPGDDTFEKGMEAGKKFIDEILYNIR